MRPKLLIIEDDKNIQKLLEINFSREDFHLFQAFEGRQGLRKADALVPDLIILDINLPGMNGIELCKSLKDNPKTKDIALIMLTVRKDEIDRVLGFELGVDDYVTKPFSPRELILRVKAVLRRREEQKESFKIEAGEIALDETKFEVKVSGRNIALTATEFKLLKYFLVNKNRLLTRENILNNVWGYSQSADIDTRTVDAHVKSLRKKLPAKKANLTTIIGMGYKLTVNV